MACANKEKATLTCRYKGEILLCFGKNTKEIRFKNSSNLGERKIYLKEYEISGWRVFFVGFGVFGWLFLFSGVFVVFVVVVGGVGFFVVAFVCSCWFGFWWWFFFLKPSKFSFILDWYNLSLDGCQVFLNEREVGRLELCWH